MVAARINFGSSLAINFGKRPHDFSWLITFDDIDRGGFAGSVFKYKFGWLLWVSPGGGDMERAEAVAGKRAAQLT